MELNEATTKMIREWTGNDPANIEHAVNWAKRNLGTIKFTKTEWREIITAAHN